MFTYLPRRIRAYLLLLPLFMSLDSKMFTLLASGIVRPVGAGVDAQGNIYVADDYANIIVKYTPM